MGKAWATSDLANDASEGWKPARSRCATTSGVRMPRVWRSKSYCQESHYEDLSHVENFRTLSAKILSCTWRKRMIW